MVDDSKEPQPSSSSQNQQHYTRNPSRNQDFTRTIANIAVSQICENEGFQGFQQSAIEALADIAIRYVQELGKASNLYANLAGRSNCNVFDIIQGLEDLGLVQGFPGASDVHHSISNSGVVREIRQYVNFVDNAPFVFDVPSFPVCREYKFSPSFLQLGNEPPGEHIPNWLPAFPSIESRKEDSPDGNAGSVLVEGGVEVIKDELKEQNLVGNDRVEANVNPFLAPPFRYGEKEVGFVEPPPSFFVRNHDHVMETYGGMSENNGVSKDLGEIVERSNTSRSDERPKVRIKLSNVKKLLPSSDIVGLKKRNQKLASCFIIEEEKDEKISWVEEPLKESMKIRELDSTEL